MSLESVLPTELDSRVVTVRCPAGASADDVFRAVRDLSAGPSLVPGAPILLDAHAASFYPEPELVHEIAALLSGERFLRGHRVALVVQPGAQFGLARMVCTVAELRGGRAGAFHDERPAVTWLVGESGSAEG
jgi:hypothetical protein